MKYRILGRTGLRVSEIGMISFIKRVTSSNEFIVKYSCKVLFSSCKWHIL